MCISVDWNLNDGDLVVLVNLFLFLWWDLTGDYFYSLDICYVETIKSVNSLLVMKMWEALISWIASVYIYVTFLNHIWLWIYLNADELFDVMTDTFFHSTYNNPSKPKAKQVNECYAFCSSLFTCLNKTSLDRLEVVETLLSVFWTNQSFLPSHHPSSSSLGSLYNTF